MDLAREPADPYDAKAVAVYRQADKLGYITRADNTVIANLMDQGEQLKAAIIRKRRSGNPWNRVQVRISLIITQGDHENWRKEDNA